ncbi:MAG: hypothetical protein CMA37_00310, partial [Euryarchaeota archaeon]|nr:hypothetical protein [Euryarchaeota archaeon]
MLNHLLNFLTRVQTLTGGDTNATGANHQPKALPPPERIIATTINTNINIRTITINDIIIETKTPVPSNP